LKKVETAPQRNKEKMTNWCLTKSAAPPAVLSNVSVVAAIVRSRPVSAVTIGVSAGTCKTC